MVCRPDTCAQPSTPLLALQALWRPQQNVIYVCWWWCIASVAIVAVLNDIPPRQSPAQCNKNLSGAPHPVFAMPSPLCMCFSCTAEFSVNITVTTGAKGWSRSGDAKAQPPWHRNNHRWENHSHAQRYRKTLFCNVSSRSLQDSQQRREGQDRPDRGEKENRAANGAVQRVREGNEVQSVLQGGAAAATKG